MSESAHKSDNVAAVLKVFSVLETLVDAREAGLGEIAQKAMTSKATTHRLLQTMIDLGYIEQEPDTERYRLTLKLFSLGAQSLTERNGLLRVADKVMGKLSRAMGESINLGVLDDREQKVVYIHKYDSAYNLSMKSTLGLRNPLHSTSLGKALLAWRDEEEVTERLATATLHKVAPRTLTDLPSLMAELRQWRHLGYTEEIEESEAGVRCMAVPVLDHLGKSVAAISMSFPLFRFDEARKPEIVQIMRAASREASTALGHTGQIGDLRAQG